MLSPNDFTPAQPVFFDAALMAALGLAVPATDLTAPLLRFADDAQDDAEDSEEDDTDETDGDEDEDEIEDEDEADDETDEADDAEIEAEDAPETV